MFKFFKKIWNYFFPIKTEKIFTPEKSEVKDVIEDNQEKSEVDHFSYIQIEELPEKIESNIVYIIGENNFYWQLAFKCPCRCNEIIQLNLLQNSSPLWKYYITKKNKITIRPSIWRTTGCRSHFILRTGKITFIHNI